jgi:hypothetical protein
MKYHSPIPHPDLKDFEIYAKEGNTEFVRHKNSEKKNMKEHEHPYWSGADHS